MIKQSQSAPRGPKKSRFDGLDVASAAAFGRTLIGHKVVNVYDGQRAASGDGRGTFLLKLANTNSSTSTEIDGTKEKESNRKVMLLIESGVRFHSTKFFTSFDSGGVAPSPFATKLRKHLRNLRLEGVCQLGMLDRVIDLRFGSGGNVHHLIIEMYGRGNIILCDGEYLILALLRVHEYTPVEQYDAKGSIVVAQKGVLVRVGNVYPVTYATTLRSVQVDVHEVNEEIRERIDAKVDIKNQNETRTGNSLGAANTTVESESVTILDSILKMNGEQALLWAKSELEVMKKWAEGDSSGKKSNSGNKKSGKKGDGSASIKALLLRPSSGVFHYGPSLIEHCIISAQLPLNVDTKLFPDTLSEIFPVNLWDLLIKALRVVGQSVIDDLSTGDGRGYILYHSKSSTAEIHQPDSNVSIPAPISTTASVLHSDKIFLEFQPHLLLQHVDYPYLEYPTFSAAVDDFFSLLEGQKRIQRAEIAEKTARDRLERIRCDQADRASTLDTETGELRLKAALVEAHADDIDKALSVVRSGLDAGLDWDALDRLVKVERSNGNPIALLIRRLELSDNAVILEILDVINYNPDKDEIPILLEIKVDIQDSAHGNARVMYARCRVNEEKSKRTIEASKGALEAAEVNAKKQIEEARKQGRAVVIAPHRVTHWFEKFHWFITSDDYLVIGGRDAQQNEVLVKKYLRPGDAYLHADVHGASSCVLRAKRRRTLDGKATEVLPLSDRALQEAGNFTICNSSAWKSRTVTSAWWVEAHQVSKTAPTGEYLVVGSFMVRGKKNFLPASQLEMGLGVMFRLGDDMSIKRHANERRDYMLITQENLDNTSDHIKLPTKIKGRLPTSLSRNQDNILSTPHINEHSVLRINDIPSSDSNVKREDSSYNNKDSIPNLPMENVDNKHSDGVDTSNEVIEFNQVSAPEGKKSQSKKKKGMSVRDRKLIKRYGSLKAAEEMLESQKKETSGDVPQVAKSIKAQELLPKANTKITRGKKAKIKKIAKKYADQDDEDRKLAIQALQGGEKLKKNSKKNKRQNEGAKSSEQVQAAAETTALLVRDTRDVVEKLSEEIRKILAQCVTVKGTENNNDGNTEDLVRWEKFDAEVLEQLILLDSSETQLTVVNRLAELNKTRRIDNFSSSLGGIIRTVKKYGHEGIQPTLSNGKEEDHKQRKTKAEKAAEIEDWREILAEDGIIEDGKENLVGGVDDTTEIEKLTGKAVADDILMYAIPVCAPYQALSKYKYRVKLTPGSQKRGKASKQCLEMFMKLDNDITNRSSNSRCLELIKAVNDNEWVQAICGEVRISAPGASKLMKKQKAIKKKLKK